MEQVRAQKGACEAYCPLCWAMRIADAARQHVKSKVPEDFWQHRAAARREALLALRSLVDAALTRDAPAPARKATRIKVE